MKQPTIHHMIALPEDLYRELMEILYRDNRTFEKWVENTARRYVVKVQNTSPVGRFGG